jgi:DNA-binding FadR family transcriptional regulator
MASRAKGSADKVSATGDESTNGARIYQRLARYIFDDLVAGRYEVGSRLPAERELCAEYGASRPAVREALIALEVQGYIDIRVGSGAYVRRVPGREDHPGFAITAFELTETRLAFEGEAAALAAKHISDDEITKLEALLVDMTAENLRAKVTEDADREFHMTIARATRNAGIVLMIEELCRLRSTSRQGPARQDPPGGRRAQRHRRGPESSRPSGRSRRHARPSRRSHGPPPVHHRGDGHGRSPACGRRGASTFLGDTRVNLPDQFFRIDLADLI